MEYYGVCSKNVLNSKMILILKMEKELFFGIIQDMIDDLDPKIREEFNLEYLEVRSEMITVDPNP